MSGVIMVTISGMDIVWQRLEPYEAGASRTVLRGLGSSNGLRLPGGLLDHPQYFFMFRGGHQPLAGNGVILSLTEEGEEAPCALPLEWVAERVDFMDLQTARYWARIH